jgi:hypothetical protein
MIFIIRCVVHRYLLKRANHHRSPAEHTSAAFSSFLCRIECIWSLGGSNDTAARPPLGSRRRRGQGHNPTVRYSVLRTPYRHNNWPRNVSHTRRTRRSLVIDRRARALGEEDVEFHWAPVNATSKEVWVHYQPGGTSRDVDAASIEHAMHDSPSTLSGLLNSRSHRSHSLLPIASCTEIVYPMHLVVILFPEYDLTNEQPL